MGGTIRARSPDGWSVVAAGCAVVRDAIIGHMVLARPGIAGVRWPRIGVTGPGDRARSWPGEITQGHSVVPGMNSSDAAPSSDSPAARGSPGQAAGRYGTLTVAAVPIGRPGDASPLLAQALAEAPLVAAEDTRRVRRLAATLGVELAGRVISYWNAVERQRSDQLLDVLRTGQDVLLVSDAGMPTISDPGYRLVAAAAEAGAPIRVLPGPSAVTAALAVSGLATDRFCFEGFPPPKAGERARRFAGLATEPRTLVFFETAKRIQATLGELAAAFGSGRRAVVCRELTKTHEEVRRGTLGELAEWAAGGTLGEITLVVEGDQGGPRITPAEAAAEVGRRAGAGRPRNEVIAAVAREYGLRRRVVYDAVLAARKGPA
jgi:16S rRNA (cytidine1402-2'-O)-methyltransferase